MYRNHTFCLLLGFWLVGFSFSLLSGLQPPTKLIAVAMVASGVSRDQNLESLQIKIWSRDCKRCWFFFFFFFSLISHHLTLDVVLVAEVRRQRNDLEEFHLYDWKNEKCKNYREPKNYLRDQRKGRTQESNLTKFLWFLGSPLISRRAPNKKWNLPFTFQKSQKKKKKKDKETKESKRKDTEVTCAKSIYLKVEL